MVNKKAQDLSIGTLILIVLGIIVLVLLILGFSMGWSNLWEKINIFSGGSSISDVITNCNVLVTSGSTYSYCNDFKKIKGDNGKTEYVNCEDPRVKGGLATQLDPCQGDSRKDKCQILAKADAIVNSVACGDDAYKTCEERGGELVTLNEGVTETAATCRQSDDTYPKNAAGVDLDTKLVQGYTEDTDNNICCVP